MSLTVNTDRPDEVYCFSDLHDVYIRVIAPHISKVSMTLPITDLLRNVFFATLGFRLHPEALSLDTVLDECNVPSCVRETWVIESANTVNRLINTWAWDAMDDIKISDIGAMNIIVRYRGKDGKF